MTTLKEFNSIDPFEEITNIANYNLDNDDKCDHLNADQLVYHSSEQYLILCLKLCKLIITNQCDIGDLVDFKRYMRLTPSFINKNISHTIKAINSSSNFDIASSYKTNNYSPLLLSHLNETECMKYGHRESYKLSLFIFGIILCFLILVLNSLTLITIIKSKRLHSITNILIANLSVSDFLSGIAFLYPCILNLLTIHALESYDSHLYKITCNIRQYYYLCLAGYSPMITSMLSSMFTLTLLAIEKYIAILHPYIYERLIEDRKYICYITLIITWTISILVSLLPMMGWNEHNKYSSYRGLDCQNSKSMPCMFERIFTLGYILLFTVICCICAIAMLGIYIRIYLIARKHSKQIAKIKIAYSSTNIQEHNPTNKTCSDYEIVTINLNIHPDATSMLSVYKLNSSKEINENDTDAVNLSFKQEKDCCQNQKSILEKNAIESEQQVCDICRVTKDTQTRSLSKSMKAMKTLLILLMGFYICWLPLIIYFLTFAGKNYKNTTIYILMFIACCNAVIDPLVYAFRNREFCKALLLNFKYRV